MSVAFDALKLSDRLQSVGFTETQARGAALALSEALAADLATKSDLTELKAELLISNWMMGFLLAFQVAIFIKMFMH